MGRSFSGPCWNKSQNPELDFLSVQGNRHKCRGAFQIHAVQQSDLLWGLYGQLHKGGQEWSGIANCDTISTIAIVLTQIAHENTK